MPLILMKLGMVDYVRDPTPHDNFGGDMTYVFGGTLSLTQSTKHNVGDLGKCHLSNLWVSFFSVFFCFLRHAPGLHFLTDRDNRCARTRGANKQSQKRMQIFTHRKHSTPWWLIIGVGNIWTVRHRKDIWTVRWRFNVVVNTDARTVISISSK